MADFKFYPQLTAYFQKLNNIKMQIATLKKVQEALEEQKNKEEVFEEREKRKNHFSEWHNRFMTEVDDQQENKSLSRKRSISYGRKTRHLNDDN
mmetsp:Transcript_30082/g.29328  ORF Transcript_30082/g.29328 Transcript_30082/m.29328 type:complete len:94 (+) Transcript_30082:982-1263(+)